jgi:hypothetical protein
VICVSNRNCDLTFVPAALTLSPVGCSTPPQQAQTSDAAVQSRLVDMGVEVFPRERQTPEALGACLKADADKCWPLIKEFGIKAERATAT